jgi:hypothetical protein
MKVSRNYMNKPHRIYGGPISYRWGDIPRVFVPRGDIYSKEYWENTSSFLKILSPPPNMSLPLKCPPPPILRPGAATAIRISRKKLWLQKSFNCLGADYMESFQPGLKTRAHCCMEHKTFGLRTFLTGKFGSN